jgi:hypothetical protein
MHPLDVLVGTAASLIIVEKVFAGLKWAWNEAAFIWMITRPMQESVSKNHLRTQWSPPLNVITVNVIIRLLLYDLQVREDNICISSNMTENCVWLLFSFG